MTNCQSFVSRLKKNESLFCFNGGETKCLKPYQRQDKEDRECENPSATPPNAPGIIQVTKGYRQMFFPGKEFDILMYWCSRS